MRGSVRVRHTAPGTQPASLAFFPKRCRVDMTRSPLHPHVTPDKTHRRQQITSTRRMTIRSKRPWKRRGDPPYGSHLVKLCRPCAGPRPSMADDRASLDDSLPTRKTLPLGDRELGGLPPPLPPRPWATYCPYCSAVAFLHGPSLL